ncbi:alkylation response protein AidB-like acyl-CoA dehydrogenase [Rhodothalassium salexigens DSM 2132]|uniref:Alkylation response protein AidB-like acyl-CoA dehydrogenase n=1 Tax=Rhodothalassium salexigens DSM 2132 TaxID=1188247 RepID=A0A4R2PNL6_RHOSA|nr:acyl-CoA dehydrogenase family protein [Rhodothalassium salexigens]MBB4210984.1 acyl-CoA dehydrogenase [Rhodothalassium salexigens DSM 2132]MBK1638715.1 acyl-CoA dehydrogenase [Rhodothalassium salexigens DSM 2132]TCP36358.1 alkylation response protein AidB-like acyl-CoA dehydrogenase [Rhodothalassium salexigens DSM 2132]
MLPQRDVYDSDHAVFRDSVRKFLAQEMHPHQDAWAEAGTSPKAFWRKAGEAGLLCPQVPEAYGGPGADFRYNCIVDEEIGYGGAPIALSVHSDIVAPYILNYGSEEQKQTWLPRMVSGETVAAVAMTEPGTGSDLQSIKTTAERDGNHYVLNGQKTFISNGQNADLILVVAKTTPEGGAKGTSLILVEAERDGFSRGRNLKKMGQKAADTSELFFDNVRVPITNCVGNENQGFIYLMQELPQERLVIAVAAAAAAQHAFDITVDYVKQRQAFGRAVAKFQNTRFKLAEMKTDLKVGWAFVDQCIAKHMDGRLTADEGAMAKLWLSEMQGRLVDDCVQLHGGYGYMMEYPIAQHYVDARVQRIYGGTSEIMKELISRFI